MNQKIRFFNKWMVLFVLFCGFIFSSPLIASADSNNSDLNTTSGDALQQEIEITGTVTDAESGEALPGVNIVVEGTTTGTTTDMDGNYTLEAPADATLVFSFVGYQQQSIEVEGQQEINVQLQPAVTELEEVVAVGYGTQRKVNLTGSVSSVQMDSLSQNQPTTDASQLLSGKTSGVWVSQNSGQPGQDQALLRIRGWGTLNNANPLVLVDGVETSISQVDPNNIESISVLKDASSAAIYGSRAANGVILITTQSGEKGQEATFSYNSYLGVQQLGRHYEIIDNSVQYMEMWNKARINQGGSILFPEEVIDGFRNNTDPYRYPNTNFFDHVFRNAMITKHNVKVSGGSENSTFFASFNYSNQDGIVKGTDSKNYRVKLDAESDIKDWLTIGASLRGNREVVDEPYGGTGRIYYMFANGAKPFTPPYTEDGRFGAPEAIYLSGSNEGQAIVDNRNPLIETANGLNRNTNYHLQTNGYLDIDIADWLNWRTQYTTLYEPSTGDRWNEIIYGYTHNGNKMLNLDYNTTVERIRNNNEYYYNIWQSTMNFDKTFAESHDISGLVGMEREHKEWKDTYARKTNPPKENLTQVDAASSGIQSGGGLDELRMLSYFGRMKYSYDDKYLTEFNLRADASSRFKEGNRWGIFPSFSVAWRLSEEPFMDNLEEVSNLKLRASWGKLGNERIAGYYPYLQTITQQDWTSYSYGESFAPGARITSLAESDITWETTTNTNIGVDVGFLNNRLNIEADYFYKKTSDILVQLPIPSILGNVSPPDQNVGEMENEGIDLSISYIKRSQNKNEFGYSIDGNVSYVINEVTKFREGDSPDQLYLIREGYPYQSLYGFKALGIYQSDSEAEEHMHANSYIPEAGDIKYEDVNGDGKINYEDKQGLGNTIPKVTYGLNFSANYKGFTFNALMKGIAGVNAYTQNAWTEPLGISGGTITKRWTDAWSPDNTDTDLPKIKMNDTWNRKESSFWTVDMSYLKLQNVQLGYTIPKNWTSQIGLRKLHIYMSAKNLLTFMKDDDYEGFNPERSTFSSGGYTYPVPRIYSVGINVNF